MTADSRARVLRAATVRLAVLSIRLAADYGGGRGASSQSSGSSYDRTGLPLEMRDRCERCGRQLMADGPARICSYECTFCPACADTMNGICPNCDGELVSRPRRVVASDLGA